MIIILLRTLLIYVFLIAIMRMMGKRQLGELEVTDLVITLLLSEISTVPLTDPSKPLFQAILPIITLASLEVLTSWLCLKIPKFKVMLSPKPAILVHNGRIDRKQMQKARISLDELMCELRQKEIADISQVQYAIIESNGKISTFKKIAEQPPSATALGIDVTENGMMRTVLCDGLYADKTLRALGLDRNWLNKQLKSRGVSPGQVFFAAVDDSGNLHVQTK